LWPPACCVHNCFHSAMRGFVRIIYTLIVANSEKVPLVFCAYPRDSMPITATKKRLTFSRPASPGVGPAHHVCCGLEFASSEMAPSDMEALG
jgi:hypothetical protein